MIFFHKNYRNQNFLELADDPSSLHQRRICRWMWYSSLHASKWRIGGRIEESRDRKCVEGCRRKQKMISQKKIVFFKTNKWPQVLDFSCFKSVSIFFWTSWLLRACTSLKISSRNSILLVDDKIFWIDNEIDLIFLVLRCCFVISSNFRGIFWNFDFENILNSEVKLRLCFKKTCKNWWFFEWQPFFSLVFSMNCELKHVTLENFVKNFWNWGKNTILLVAQKYFGSKWQAVTICFVYKISCHFLMTPVAYLWRDSRGMSPGCCYIEIWATIR